MADPADLILTNARVHTLTPASVAAGESPDASAVAVRDGRIVRVSAAADGRFLEGVSTTVLDLDGRPVFPGFIDAHTHLRAEGERTVHADLSGADSRSAALSALQEQGAADGWIVGVGYDESTWPTTALNREHLDTVSEHRPVVAIRVDMHTAACNTAAVKYVRDRVDDAYVRTDDGQPTGIVVEEAVDVLREAVAPGTDGPHEVLTAALERAVSLGITGVHDKVKDITVARAYRDLAAAEELPIRVRIDYWRDHLDAVTGAGLRPNCGGDRVTVGGIKTFTDGSFGGRTAKVSKSYTDTDTTGQWVLPPDDLRTLVEEVAAADFQAVVHAIGDVAIEETVEALAATPGTRHRVEHAELASDAAIETMAENDIIASMQPNFHRWARPDGLYETVLGADRTTRTNRFGRMRDAGVVVAFGSDCMPMDPLYGIAHAVDAPTPEQSLPIAEAFRAYTYGGAYAGFAEAELGTIEVGKRGDFVVLDESPWTADSIADIDPVLTVVDGELVYDARE